jgi:hypothetical protein
MWLWNNGIVECEEWVGVQWNNGIVEHWKDGVQGYWNAGILKDGIMVR